MDDTGSPASADGPPAARVPWYARDLAFWLEKAGVAVIVTATLQVSAQLGFAVYETWTTTGSGFSFVYPSGYYSVLLLAGVLLLVWAHMRGPSGTSPSGWTQPACLVAASTGALLALSQLVVAYDKLFYVNLGVTSGRDLPRLPAGDESVRGSLIFSGVSTLGEAVPAVLAVLFGVMVVSRITPDSRESAGPAAAVPRWQRSMAVAVALGVTAYIALAIVAHAGGRSQPPVVRPLGAVWLGAVP